MFRTALRNVLAHKARLLMTVLAVMLGVAFVSGTLVFTDTLGNAFRNQSAKSYDDVAVAVSTYADGTTTRENPGIDEATLDEDPGAGRRRLGHRAGLRFRRGRRPGRQAHRQRLVQHRCQLLPRQGRQGPRLHLHRRHRPGEERSGRAGQGHREQGRVPRRRPGAGRHERSGEGVHPLRDLHHRGRRGRRGRQPRAVRHRDRTAALPQARRLPGRHRDRRRGRLGPGGAGRGRTAAAQGRDRGQTGKALADQQAKDTENGLTSLNTMLLAFAGIALFVGVFLITNTFTMLIAQRTRELALMRAIGASRRQVKRSVLIEAAVVGDTRVRHRLRPRCRPRHRAALRDGPPRRQDPGRSAGRLAPRGRLGLRRRRPDHRAGRLAARPPGREDRPGGGDEQRARHRLHQVPGRPELDRRRHHPARCGGDRRRRGGRQVVRQEPGRGRCLLRPDRRHRADPAPVPPGHRPRAADAAEAVRCLRQAGLAERRPQPAAYRGHRLRAGHRSDPGHRHLGARRHARPGDRQDDDGQHQGRLHGLDGQWWLARRVRAHRPGEGRRRHRALPAAVVVPPDRRRAPSRRPASTRATWSRSSPCGRSPVRSAR